MKGEVGVKMHPIANVTVSSVVMATGQCLTKKTRKFQPKKGSGSSTGLIGRCAHLECLHLAYAIRKNKYMINKKIKKIEK